MEIEKMLIKAAQNGDKGSLNRVYQQAVQAYINRILDAIMPMSDLECPFALVALRCIISAMESSADGCQRRIADNLMKAGMITSINLPDMGRPHLYNGESRQEMK